MAGPVLAIVEAPFRGYVERGYADCFYLVQMLGAQLGRVDLLLRGEAVLLARRPPDPSDGRWDAGLALLAAHGSRVLVDDGDAARFGVRAEHLIDDASITPFGGTPAWSTYDAIWFL